MSRVDFFLRVYFPAQHRIVKVQFLTVIPFLDDLQKAVLVAFMHENYELATSETFAIDARHLRFCEAVGDDPSSRTELQEQERQQMMVENPDYFVGSYIYSDVDKQVMKYDPQSALNRDTIMVVHPVKTSETFANDCIVKALNFMLRFCYFTHQLQVLRLAVRNLKVKKDVVNKLKLDGGIRANMFYEEFLIKEDKAYRLARVMLDVAGSKQDFYSGGDLWKFLRDFVKANMLPVNDNEYDEILVTTIGHNIDGTMYSHAGAFVRREVAARNKSGKKVEVYYYDGNLNHACSIGG